MRNIKLLLLFLPIFTSQTHGAWYDYITTITHNIATGRVIIEPGPTILRYTKNKGAPIRLSLQEEGVIVNEYFVPKEEIKRCEGKEATIILYLTKEERLSETEVLRSRPIECMFERMQTVKGRLRIKGG